jgi:hypothetical protein
MRQRQAVLHDVDDLSHLVAQNFHGVDGVTG